MPKLLLLANIFGLDTALTVGQMQGKCFLYNVSKVLAEDIPVLHIVVLGHNVINQLGFLHVDKSSSLNHANRGSEPLSCKLLEAAIFSAIVMKWRTLAYLNIICHCTGK